MEFLKIEITGLSARDIFTITSIFNKYTSIKEVRLFGSRANGSFKKGSDIDLAVMNNDISEQDIIKIRNEFEESDIPFFVDFINYNTLPESELKEHIKKAGVLFYKIEFEEEQ